MLIELDGAAFGYGSGPPLLSDVSLSIAPGSFHFLTGPSGAGKTTFLRLCYGALVPERGQVRIFGRRLDEMSRDDVARMRRRIGVVHQDCQFLDHLDVARNVLLPLGVTGRAGPDDERNLAELLSWVGLAHRAGARPPELSGGERQRAALARAVIGGPEIILADEPTGNVDWDMSLRLLRLLVELNRLGKAVVVATHDLALIRAAKTEVQARVLRIGGGGLRLAGADL